ncbi:hypothetical protein GCM10009133_23200 [Cocleimonas flava]|uniref:Uncharacterized protein n=1 Tax=Cocleimonas flava TaxID=634765 RepID=A0A4R1ENM5_9GAMM|nr:hypothetical protein [Cocleimonas flava]TCJ82856.1 hypothetical protein EV695_3593 [Cocleimonas flava]
MTIRNYILSMSTAFLCFYFSLAQATETKPDLSSSIKEDNPASALTLAKMLKHSDAKYGDTQVDTYYSFESPPFTLLDFPLKSCTFTLFEKALGHITCQFKGEENNKRLIALLTQSIGEDHQIKIADSMIKRWIGKNEFHYEINHTEYNQSYVFSITNDTYRKFNKAYNGN